MFLSDLTHELSAMGMTLLTHQIQNGEGGLASVWGALTPDVVLAMGDLAKADIAADVVGQWVTRNLISGALVDVEEPAETEARVVARHAADELDRRGAGHCRGEGHCRDEGRPNGSDRGRCGRPGRSRRHDGGAPGHRRFHAFPFRRRSRRGYP